MLLNLINGTGVYNVPVVGSQVTQGKCFFVAPGTGSDGNDGLNPERPLKTLKKALALCTANKNDTVFVLAQGNSSSATTDYVEDVTGLVWNKDLCHIIGIGNSSMIGQRARIAGKTGTVFTAPLVTVSANGCTFANLGIFFGVAATTTTSIGALMVSGDRNKFVNCQISGIGADEMDVTGAYSLKLSGADENTFDNCYIGLTTVGRGTAANAELILASDCARNFFIDCVLITKGDVNTHQIVQIPTAGLIDDVVFKRCTFRNAGVELGVGVNLLEALDVAAGTSGHGGAVILDNCSGFGIDAWEATSGASGRTYSMNAPTPAASTNGIGAIVA